MTTNVLNSMGAGLDSSESSPKTADDPAEKVATYGMPYPSMNIASLYASNGRSPPNMGLLSGMSGIANSMSQWPSMYGQSMVNGQFGGQGMHSQSLYSDGLDSSRRMGFNMMPNQMGLSGQMNGFSPMLGQLSGFSPMSAQMAGLSPMTGQMAGFSPMFGFNQQFPQSGYGNYRPMMGMGMNMGMGMGMGMNMMNPGFGRSLPGRRSGRRYRRYRSSERKRYRRRPIDVDEDYPNYKTSYRSSASEDRYRLHAPEADNNNAIEPAAHYPDHTPSSSENIYKVATGLVSGSNKEFLKIGGIGGNILTYLANSLLNGKPDQKITDKNSVALNTSKEISSDSPFIQFGSTKISLKRNVKGGITVTVGAIKSLSTLSSLNLNIPKLIRLFRDQVLEMCQNRYQGNGAIKSDSRANIRMENNGATKVAIF